MTDITTENYADVNARAIDGWNARGWEWGTPLSHEEYLEARQGEWRMITTENYADVNARAIDGWNARGWEWGTPLSHEEYLDARQGEWRMLLTPPKPVPPEGSPSDLSGLRVLGLACG